MLLQMGALLVSSYLLLCHSNFVSVYTKSRFMNVLRKWIKTDIYGYKWITKWIFDENRCDQNLAGDVEINW